MKKLLEKSLAVTLLIIMVVTVNVFAYDTWTGRVKVPTGSTFVVAKTAIKRSLDYKYAIVKADSVYPTGEGKKDTYTRCKTRLYYNSTAISNVVTLTEGNLTKVTIYNGHLSKKTFRIKFAGNDPDLSAYVNYYYNGK